MDIDLAQFHLMFFEEAFEALEVLEAGLLHLDPAAVEVEAINSIFRAAHSIKGGSATFGFDAIADFTHLMETLLDEMRNDRRPITKAVIAILLHAVDVLREMLTSTRDGGNVDPARITAQRNLLQQTLENNPTIPLPVIAETPLLPVGESQHLGWQIVFIPHRHLMRTGNDPLRIIQELARLGNLEVTADIAALPTLAELIPEDCYLSWRLVLHGASQRYQVEEVFDWVEGACELTVTPYTDAEAPSVLPPAPLVTIPAVAISAPKLETAGPESKNIEISSHSIRVDTQKIDTLINQVGELVITQSMLGLLGETFDMRQLERLREGLIQLERHTRALQENVMRIRMLPMSVVFNRLPRLVHDLSARLGKQVELRLSGETTEVDKTVIEKIGDPLVHLVRNSLDHGIELPDERRAAAKAEIGSIWLNAFHRGGNVMIEIRDDGRGLNPDKILNKALERGLITEDQHLSPQQLLELIFMPGFSTADQVSEVSGRGVGMDVVRKNIHALGGSLILDSVFGRGTSLLIRLPLTLAIMDSQTVAVGSETYIVPLVSIVESVQIREAQVKRMAGGGETFKLRDDYLPILRLHRILGVESPYTQCLEDGLLVVVEGDGHRYGLFVDSLLGQQQVVVKSLETHYRKVVGIAGATILGDGSVALILDVPGLLQFTGPIGMQRTFVL